MRWWHGWVTSIGMTRISEHLLILAGMVQHTGIR
jgi:hypothetical protein